jgi:hypothetical protein
VGKPQWRLCKHCGISFGKISTYSYFAIVWMTWRNNTCDINYSPSLFTFLQIINSMKLTWFFLCFIIKMLDKCIFRNRPIRNKNCLWQPYLLMDRDKISNLYRGPLIDAFYHVSVHLAKRFQSRRFFRNQPIRNKNCLWRPCLLTGRDKMSNRNRRLSTDASYQVSVHLAKRFPRRRI